MVSRNFNFHQREHYPYVVLPRLIEQHLQGPHKLPDPALIPKPWFPNRPTEPVRPSEPHRGSLPVLLIGTGLIIGLTFLALKAGAVLYALFGMAVLLGLGWSLINTFRYPARRRYYERVLLPQYQQEQQQYLEQLDEWERECSVKVLEYEQLVKQKESEHQRMVEQVRRQWEMGETWPSDLHPAYLNTPSEARAGRQDGRFRLFLSRFLPEHTDFEVKVLDCRLGLLRPGFLHPYTPDIALQVSKANHTLLVDIEIDEPWYQQGSERVPIHCLWNSRQMERDEFFRANDWVVIRFSEKQVVLQSEQCAWFIVGVLQTVFVPGSTQNIVSPSVHRRWDEDEAVCEPRY